jgi:hypothetical protein
LGEQPSTTLNIEEEFEPHHQTTRLHMPKDSKKSKIFTREQAMKAERGSTGIALLFL